jgi:uncharacterized protein (TIGR02246 family)
MRTRTALALLGTVLCLGGVLVFARRGAADPPAAGGGARPAAGDQDAIRTALQGYVAAFNKGDLDGLMAYWSADPEFITEAGESSRGREALAALFKTTFAEQKGATMKITVKSIRFVRPDVALQDGLVTMTAADGTADRGPYTAVWTKADGKWLLARVQDLPGEAPPPAASAYERLKQLDWLVGDWESEGKHTPVTFSCKWSRGQSFLVIDETIHLHDQEPMTLTEYIGWDPLQQRVRSWVFDSRGGFGEGQWSRSGNRWAVASTGVLSDGRRASSTSTWTYVDAKTCQWDSVDREIDSRPAPDVRVKYVRQTAEKK